MNGRVKVYPFQKSIWENENNPQNVKQLSLELKDRNVWITSPVQEASDITSKQVPGVNQATEGCWGCSTWPKTFAFIIGLGLICAAVVLLPIVLTNTLGVVKRNTTTTVTTTIGSTSSTTTTTDTSTSSTSSTTTTTTTRAICSTGCVNISFSTLSQLAFYSFDLNTNDATGIYSASGNGTPIYQTGYIYSGIYFNAALAQRLSAPAMRLNSRSFTIEFWFTLINGVSYTYAFFGQLSVYNTAKECLFLIANGGRLGIGFYNDDTGSSTVLQSNTWYHAAFIYDNDKRQRFIYINGILDIQSGVGVGPYFGTSGPMTFGGADIYGGIGVPYFSGMMDHLTVTTRAKTACEILNDATLAAYFPFDGSFTDAGPNFLTATSSGASFTSGFVNQGAYLSGSNAYIQISSLTGLGRTNYSFSIVFWVYPIVPGILVHVSSLSSGLGWCLPMIGISSSGNIVVQVYNYISPYIITGPIIQLNTWTHIVQTYSPTNGQSLYINGILYSTLSNATFYSASGLQNYLTIGNSLSATGGCSNPGILPNPFQGMIDELRIYSRELSSTDVCLLAWP